MGDPHAKPDVVNDRFEWAGQIIVDREPDYFVCIGDFGDMPSLSSYDKGKRKFEGRRYIYDLEAVHDALEKLTAPIKRYNSLRKKKLKTKMIMTLGNHDNRINKAANDASEFYDFISTDDLKFAEYGFEVHNFLEVVTVAGINFSHYFPSGAMGRPIGSTTGTGNALASKLHESCISGHNHLLDFSRKTTPSGRQIHCGSIGWYGDHVEDYLSESAQKEWWNGLVFLNNCKDGQFDLETIRMEVIKQQYA